jgi:hypothetical protein
MAEFTASAVQTVNPGETVIFDVTVHNGGCNGLNHRDGSGEFLIAGGPRPNGPCCCVRDTREVPTSYKANIAIPTGGDVGAISMAIAVDGATLPYTTMIVTPAAVEEFFNISVTTNTPVWKGCCQSVTIRNTSNQPILVQQPLINFKEE